jgi:hypothetical protein
MIACRKAWFIVILCCLSCVSLVRCASAQDEYTRYMGQCEQAKQVGNFAAMDAAITNALQHGPGNEYAWRSLAWAQARQGKWKESLANAWENVRRNGESGWSLQQLADSALGNGDFALARKTLDKADRLPAGKRRGSEGALEGCRNGLRSATEKRTYQLEFTVDLGQGGPTEKSVWLLIPQVDSRQQHFTYSVRNVVSAKPHHAGIHDYIEVVQRPGQPFFLDGTLVLKPFCLGSARLAKVPSGDCPTELKLYLDKFLNYTWWDPQLPAVQAIVTSVKGKTSAETVQNILDWFNKNIHYDASIQDDPELGPLGTIIKLRYGGCHHMAGLFVALSRAAGVPACVAHGNAIPTDDKPFEFSPIGHGWAEVYINTIGWVPVEPGDVNSLRMFSANRAYMAVGPSNRPPEYHQFAGAITYKGQEYGLVSIQGCQKIKGQLISTGDSR